MTRALIHKTPKELWTGTKPDVSHFREFGKPVWIYAKQQTDKLRAWANQFIFMGFNNASSSI